ncbi:family 1 encapsulin nanocompartment shell protein [Effusibacillus lacus]|uniref:Type 1 encapsulin shell protein n=1 Tax=Effusibacillus lacus TaxID=1348429 RepID=A0A292YNG5_9BACL|nr:family 1 encapsulin nanocompartment shell protein [Effusibacillus lacus]TCS71404.1 putative linocin/CFP29 family protein [Effusibacillus lacus]GAX89934.1 bacteriocin [Effusibacillus lacus]
MTLLRAFDSDIPLRGDEMERLHAVIVEVGRRQLIGRRILEIYGPLGAGIQGVPSDRFQDVELAAVDQLGEEEGDAFGTGRRVQLTIPILYKDFIIHWRDVELARQLGTEIDFSAAAGASSVVATKEDDLIFNGNSEFGIEGLTNATGRLTHMIEDWTESGRSYTDVVQMTTKLIENGQFGPFAMVTHPALYAKMLRVHQGTNVLEIEHIRELVTAGVYQSPVLKENTGVIVSVGRQNFDLAVAEDLSVAYLGAERMNFPFRVYECLVPRIKRPAAICSFSA